MKSDTLTFAAIVFLVGIAMSGLGLMDWNKKTSEAPTELQRGFEITK